MWAIYGPPSRSRTLSFVGLILYYRFSSILATPIGRPKGRLPACPRKITFEFSILELNHFTHLKKMLHNIYQFFSFFYKPLFETHFVLEWIKSPKLFISMATKQGQVRPLYYEMWKMWSSEALLYLRWKEFSVCDGCLCHSLLHIAYAIIMR